VGSPGTAQTNHQRALADPRVAGRVGKLDRQQHRELQTAQRQHAEQWQPHAACLQIEAHKQDHPGNESKQGVEPGAG